MNEMLKKYCAQFFMSEIKKGDILRIKKKKSCVVL